MSPMSDTHLLIEIAHLYYDEDLTQQQIAKKMNMSRSLVSKLLAKAKKVGVVEVIVHSEIVHPYKEIEDRLRKVFGLNYVKVTDSEGDPSNNSMYRETVRYLTMRLSDCKYIVVSASKTIRNIAEQLSTSQTFPEVTFVPASGGLGELRWENNANINASILAQKYGAKYQQFYSPIVVDSMETKKLLCAQPFIKNVLNNGRRADIALVGIGGSYQRFELEESYLQELKTDYGLDENQVRGDMSFNYYNHKGQIIDCKWNNLLMGLSLEDYKKIPEVLCVVNEIDKAESLYVAAKRHLITSLITNISVAKRVLFNYSKDLYHNHDRK